MSYPVTRYPTPVLFLRSDDEIPSYPASQAAEQAFGQQVAEQAELLTNHLLDLDLDIPKRCEQRARLLAAVDFNQWSRIML